MRTSNSLVYKTKVTKGDEDIYIEIRLDDVCNNGHQDFSITADIYKKGKSRVDKYHLGGGCVHEEIISVAPQFKIFVDLHLCDYKGIPMHATANGFYHLINGFNSIKSEQNGLKTKYCEYYRISSEQFDVLSLSKNEIQFYLYLKELDILNQWEQYAKKAIEILEGLTGETFLIDSKRTQLVQPSEDAINEELERQKRLL